MNKCEFGEIIKKVVLEELGEDYTATSNEVKKNNNVKLTGITITCKNCNISPIIYLDQYYDKYMEEAISLDEIVNDILRIYKSHAMDKDADMRWFMDFDNVKGRIIFALINTEQNRELLADTPNIPFLNLSIIFKVFMSDKANENATVTIKNQHCKIWEVDISDLLDAARRNMPRLLPTKILNICEAIAIDGYNYIPMYVLTNELSIFGASSILDKSTVSGLAETLQSNLYLLPSSIQEFIAVPEYIGKDVDALKIMVQTINDTELADEDILSYDVYYYDREKEEIVML